MVGMMEFVFLYKKAIISPAKNALTIIPSEYVWATPKNKLVKIAAIQNGNRSEKKRSIKPLKMSSSKMGVSIADPISNNIWYWLKICKFNADDCSSDASGNTCCNTNELKRILNEKIMNKYAYVRYFFNTLKSNDGNNNVLAGSYLNMKNN